MGASPRQQQFVQDAEICVDAAKKTYGIDLSYDLASIKKLDEIIEDMGKPTNLAQMVLIFGAFLGEAIRRLYKGKWEWNDHYKTWAVTFPVAKGGEDGAFVFAKVRKRFVDGSGDSLYFYIVVIDGWVTGKIEPR